MSKMAQIFVLIFAFFFSVTAFSEDSEIESHLTRFNAIFRQFKIEGFDRTAYLITLSFDQPYIDRIPGVSIDNLCSIQEAETKGSGTPFDKTKCESGIADIIVKVRTAGIPTYNGQTKQRQAYFEELEQIISTAKPVIDGVQINIKDELLNIRKMSDDATKIKTIYNFAKKIIGIYNPSISDADNLDINHKVKIPLSTETLNLATPSLKLSLSFGHNRMICRHMAKVLADFYNYVFQDIVARYKEILYKNGPHALVELNHDNFPIILLDVTNHSTFTPFDRHLSSFDSKVKRAIAMQYTRNQTEGSDNYCELPYLQRLMNDNFNQKTENQIMSLKFKNIWAAAAIIKFNPELNKSVCRPFTETELALVNITPVETRESVAKNLISATDVISNIGHEPGSPGAYETADPSINFSNYSPPTPTPSTAPTYPTPTPASPPTSTPAMPPDSIPSVIPPTPSLPTMPSIEPNHPVNNDMDN